jgi:predicted phosphodiesterase
VQIIGDVHANAHALRVALAHGDDADAVVLIGDLLTYGTDVQEVLDQVLDAQRTRGAILIRGNHDRIYDEILRTGTSSYAASLPDWIRESIEHTVARLDRGKWEALELRDEFVLDGVVFAHAGPWPSGDDTYLSHRDDYVAAADALARRGAFVGVFGHTHRARVFSPEDQAPRAGPISLRHSRDRGRPLVVNVGSVGQPRDRDGAVWRARLTLESETAAIDLSELTYDREGHLARIESASMSRTTRDRLLAFHRRPSGAA